MESNPSTAIACFPVLEPDECDAVLARLSDVPWRAARVVTPHPAGGVAPEIRRCEVAHVDDAALVARLSARVQHLNASVYEFDLHGLAETDPVGAVRYGDGGHLDWHIDNSTLEYATRKLSFTVQLTDPADYDGGDLEFAIYEKDYGGAGYTGYREQIRRRGAITVFPSFHLHRVTPITRGVRTVLVGWLHGPRFR